MVRPVAGSCPRIRHVTVPSSLPGSTAPILSLGNPSVSIHPRHAVSLPVRSPKLFSLAALYNANKELLATRLSDDDASQSSLVAVASEYWTAVSKAIPEWSKVKNGELKALELRQENICSHSIVLRALGSVGAELMRDDPTGWKGKLLDLKDVNWSKKNLDWENVCIIANSVVSNRQARLQQRPMSNFVLACP